MSTFVSIGGKSYGLFQSVPLSFDSPLTERLTAETRKQINEERFYPHEVHAFLKDFTSKEGMKVLLKNYLESYKRLPSLALRAKFLGGEVNDAQFATVCMVYQGVEQFVADQWVSRSYLSKENLVSHNVFGLLSLSTEVLYEQNLFEICHVLDDSRQKDIDRFLKSIFLFSDEQLTQFKAALQKAPPSEQYFYLFKLPITAKDDCSFWSPMYQAIRGVIPFLGPVDYYAERPPKQIGNLKQTALVLPSLTMVALFLKTYFKENAVGLRPLVGRCSTKIIEKYLMQGERVVQVGMQNAEVPIMADGHVAGPLIFTFHEIYHAIRYSMIKVKEQIALRHINNLFHEILTDLLTHPEREVEVKTFKHHKWVLVDGELHKSVLGDKFGQLFNSSKLREYPPAQLLIILDMVRQKEKWAKEFNLSRDDLLEAEQKLYDELASGKNEQDVFNSITTPTSTTAIAPTTADSSAKKEAESKEKIDRQWSNYEDIEEFLRIFDSPNGIQVLLQKYVDTYHLLPALGKKTLQWGSITTAQLATLCIIYEAVDQFVVNPFVVKSFIKGKDGFYIHNVSGLRRTGAEDIYKQRNFEVWHALNDSRQAEANRLLKATFLFSNEELEQFKTELRKAPASEQNFYVIKLPISAKDDVFPWSPMYEAYRKSMLFFQPVDYSTRPLAGQYLDWKQKALIVPSFTMLELLFNIHYKEHAVQTVPVFGQYPSHIKERHFMDGKMVINVGMPGDDVPLQQGQEHVAGIFITTLRDIYRILRFAAVKTNERLALQHIVGLCNDIIKTPLSAEVRNQLDIYKQKIIEGELHRSLAGDKFGTLFQITNLKALPFVEKLIIQNMAKEKEMWKQKFNLSADDLLEPERKLYEELAKSFQE